MYNTELPNRSELPSSKQLLTSTLIALIVAAVLLVTVVLPSEYGIDPTRIGRVLGLTQMGEIKMSLAREAEAERKRDAATGNLPLAPAVQVPAVTPPTVVRPDSSRNDTMTVTLKPGEGAEIKLMMTKDQKASYQWNSTGPVNFDAHGDGPNREFASYKKGTGSNGDSGDITASFTGSHGWFWRNRTNDDVTITIKTSGEYSEMKRVV